MNLTLKTAAVALLAFPAASLAQWDYNPYGYARYGLYDGYGLYGGYDGEPGEDDWFYDYYDLGYEYDDRYLDYYLDTYDVAESETLDDLDDIEDAEDLEEVYDVEDLDDFDDFIGRRRIIRSGDTYMDSDAYDDEFFVGDEALYEGYGFD